MTSNQGKAGVRSGTSSDDAGQRSRGIRSIGEAIVTKRTQEYLNPRIQPQSRTRMPQQFDPTISVFANKTTPSSSVLPVMLNRWVIGNRPNFYITYYSQYIPKAPRTSSDSSAYALRFIIHYRMPEGAPIVKQVSIQISSNVCRVSLLFCTIA